MLYKTEQERKLAELRSLKQEWEEERAETTRTGKTKGANKKPRTPKATKKKAEGDSEEDLPVVRKLPAEKRRLL